MRFLHAADLHLGLGVTRFSRETNRRVGEARFAALDNLVSAAKEREVDFVLIAGDLFDDNHVESVVAVRAFKVLDSLNLPVYVLPGNHDPLTPDSVWERPPWKDPGRAEIKVLGHRRPLPIAEDVILYPCPLTQRTSLEDPTAWIPARQPEDRTLRIGVAHGSLRDRENLPEDDHLIDRFVADRCGLDYLALGHWHSLNLYPDRGGVRRTAYPGVHEPMRFRGFQTGWTPYSDAAPDLFADDGRGRVLCVTLHGPGAVPEIEPIEVGNLRWLEETYEVHSEEDLGRIIRDLALRPEKHRLMLRLSLRGVLGAAALPQLDELCGSEGGPEGGVLSRYLWAEVDRSGLVTEPKEEELSQLVGNGILRHVFDRLTAEANAADASRRAVAAHALLVLYRLAHEVKR
jgi:DNA repair exonuclease SbcCD nuclease subunit